MFLGQSWWNCEDGVWGRVAGIVKKLCVAEFLELLRRCFRAELVEL